MTPRALAVRALVRQEQSGYANLVWDTALKRCEPPLSARDAAFAASIFYTTMEHLNLLDWCLERFSKKPVSKLDPPVRAILRAGLAQARWMQVPVPAAVNESVKLTRVMGKASASGMVNAVLRRAAALQVSETDFAEPFDKLVIYHSLSEPVARLLLDQYGKEALAMMTAFEKTDAGQETAIRVNPLQTSDEALTAELEAEHCTVRSGPWPHSLLVRFPASPAAVQPFSRGYFHVQGIPSQFAALCVEARPGDRVWDCCAAPGGKSLTLAESMRNEGRLLCSEMVPNRVRLIEKALDRCGITCADAVCADAASSKYGTFDRILCDVPCSGLGIIAKKPDIRYKSLDQLETLVTVQQKILENAAEALAENGRLVYSTCTVNEQENQKQIERFLQNHPDFAVAAPSLNWPGVRDTGFGSLFLPHETGTDGFFVCILKKNLA